MLALVSTAVALCLVAVAVADVHCTTEYSDGWGNSVTLQVHWINNYSINVQATWSFSEIDDGNYRLKCENKTVDGEIYEIENSLNILLNFSFPRSKFGCTFTTSHYDLWGLYFGPNTTPVCEVSALEHGAVSSFPVSNYSILQSLTPEVNDDGMVSGTPTAMNIGLTTSGIFTMSSSSVSTTKFSSTSIIIISSSSTVFTNSMISSNIISSSSAVFSSSITPSSGVSSSSIASSSIVSSIISSSAVSSSSITSSSSMSSSSIASSSIVSSIISSSAVSSSSITSSSSVSSSSIASSSIVSSIISSSAVSSSSITSSSSVSSSIVSSSSILSSSTVSGSTVSGSTVSSSSVSSIVSTTNEFTIEGNGSVSSAVLIVIIISTTFVLAVLIFCCGLVTLRISKKCSSKRYILKQEILQMEGFAVVTHSKSLLDITLSPSLVTLVSPLERSFIDLEITTTKTQDHIEIDETSHYSKLILSDKLHRKLNLSDSCETTSDPLSYESCSLDQESTTSSSPSIEYIPTNQTSPVVVVESQLTTGEELSQSTAADHRSILCSEDDTMKESLTICSKSDNKGFVVNRTAESDHISVFNSFPYIHHHTCSY